MIEGRLKIIVLAVVWLATLSGGLAWFLSSQLQYIAIAGGPRHSESYELAVAIADVFNRNEENITAEVFETGGSSENVRLLEEGKVDIATLQADTPVGGNVQALAVLYDDAYQLIANLDSGIENFHDIGGRRIAIPPRSSGQNAAFWRVAGYYGLAAEEIIALPMSEDAANFAMMMHQVDAVFRVRAPGNQAIRELVSNYPVQLVPIPHAQALSLSNPAIHGATIAEGAYRGYPPLPVRATPTAMVERLLAARVGLEEEITYAITRLLFERRSDLVARSSLAGFIKPVTENDKLSIPVHSGARRYYDREKPSFAERNARVLSALLYGVAILSSAAIALRSSWMRRRRIRMGDYNRQLMDIADKARKSSDNVSLNNMKDQLIDMLRLVIEDLDGEQVTQGEFEHFSFTWRAVDTLVRDRQLAAERLL